MASVTDIRCGDEHIGLCGMRIERLLSAELFADSLARQRNFAGNDLSTACHERWTDLAAALVALPSPVEGMMSLAVRGLGPDDPREVHAAFLAMGRGPDSASARRAATEAMEAIHPLVVSTLDYAELRSIDDHTALQEIARLLCEHGGVEIRRRHEMVTLSHGMLGAATHGFQTGASAAKKSRSHGDLTVQVLFPWVPSNDPWRRLLEIMLTERGQTVFAVHIQGMAGAPEAVLATARQELTSLARLAQGILKGDEQGRALLHDTAGVLQQQAILRHATIQGGLLAARVFVIGDSVPSPALVATARQSVDDVSSRPEQAGAQTLFRGGTQICDAEPGEALARLAPEYALLFGPQEASAVLRTPMPVDMDMPGLVTTRARTAAMLGKAGEDIPLGINVHRDVRRHAALDEASRFRHCYVIGQTGTGKSTLLLNMILHDIHRGRGVAVLDPHGTLIEDVLLRIPHGRMEDVVLVDVADLERPIGFNVLRIDERDPARFRFRRDLLIDDLHSYLERTLPMEMLGPVFESHFRNMLVLLLGDGRDSDVMIPNLMVLRMLYSNTRLRKELCARMQGQDPVLDDFIAEATAASGEGSLRNVASYVTSKFNRFVSDLALRNITCQRTALDLSGIVNRGGILLFDLGKGRFGDHAAGLLASQVVSRIRGEVMKRGAGGDSRPFHLYADEFQLFADDRFGELLAEARKFRLSLTLAHQYMSQLPVSVREAVLGNAGTIMCFRVGAADAELLEPSFSPHFRQRDLMSLPNFRAYVRSTGSLGLTPFSVETPALPSGGDPEIAEQTRERSRNRYGRSRAEVEAEVAATYRAYSEYTAMPPQAS